MDAAFAWIGRLAEWFGQFVPRWVIVRTTQGAVKFVRGSKPVALGPGIHWFWPAMTEMVVWPTARQSMNFVTQTITTKDGRAVALSAMIVYEIKDLIKIVAETWDPEDTIKDITLGSIHDVCCGFTLEDLLDRQRSGALMRDLRRESQKDLERYGVRVLRTTLTDLAPARVIRLLQGE